MKRITSSLFVLLFALAPTSLLALDWQHDDHMRAALVADKTQLAAGDTLRLGLVLEPDKGWHNYWKNPGDSGLATRINWSLPEGVEVGDIRWPTPELEALGDLVNYGFGSQHVLLSDLRLPADFSGDRLDIEADAHWLVCEDICIPGSASFAFSIEVSDTSQVDQRHAGLFDQAEAAQPTTTDWSLRYQVEDGEVLFLLEADHDAFAAIDNGYLFAGTPDLVDHSATPKIAISDRQVAVRHPVNAFFSQAPEQFPAVLVSDGADGQDAWAMTARLDTSLVLPPLDQADMRAASTSAEPAQAASPRRSIWLIFVFALIGGLILNLMPCVFPVLSLKALHVAESAREHPGRQRAQGLAYTAGVISTFLLVAAALLLLRSGGQSLGWGFQLQSVWFVGLMAYLMFLIGLNLSGVFDVGTRMMGVGQNLTKASGLRGSFFTGVLAVIVATPCTAPFMGIALGYSLAAPAVESLAVFAALGLGMALPFLLLAYIPRAADVLPKPGRWMNTFKQVLAFPMYLTGVWLLWVLGRQTSADGMALAGIGMVALGYAVWVWQRSHQSRNPARLIARGSSLAATAIAIALLISANQLSNLMAGDEQAVADENAISIAYHPDTLAQLRAEGETVFINMTADWCISCLVNERAVLARDPVYSRLASDEVVYMKGDWTHQNPQITAFLESFERNGVPLYVVYHGESEGKILPQVLTTGTVMRALDR